MSDEVELVECASCSSDYRPDDLATTRSGEVLCEDCRIYCERCDNFDYESGSRYVEGCGNYCEVCADNYTFWCERCESTYSDNDSSFEVSDIGVYWCEDCCQNNANWCDSCDMYYRDGCDDCNGSRLINQYSYKPDPVFYGKDKNKLYFGIELEMEIRDGELNDSANYLMEMLGDFVYLKEDSSINSGGYRGFEMVSHPASLEYFASNKNLWSALDYLKQVHTARSWDAKSCGLHVHISRDGFRSGAHTHRFLSLIYKNSDKMMRLGGRKSTYAKFNDVYKYDDFDRPYFTLADKVANPRGVCTERYSAVNTQNEHTLELRFFRGTTRPSGVLSAIELAHASVEYTRDMTLADVKLGMLKWDWFYDYVETNNGFYPNLYERMSKVSHVNLKNIEMINA